MACTYTSTLINTLGCNDSVGGIKAVYLANHSGLTYSLDANNQITGTTGAVTFYKVEQELETAELQQKVTNSRANGTSNIEISLMLQFLKISASRRAAIAQLIQGRTLAIVEDNLGNYLLCGEVNALTVTDGSGNTGKAMGDTNGFLVTLFGKEISFCKLIDAATFATMTA